VADPEQGRPVPGTHPRGWVQVPGVAGVPLAAAILPTNFGDRTLEPLDTPRWQPQSQSPNNKRRSPMRIGVLSILRLPPDETGFVPSRQVRGYLHQLLVFLSQSPVAGNGSSGSCLDCRQGHDIAEPQEDSRNTRGIGGREVEAAGEPRKCNRNTGGHFDEIQWECS